MNEKKTVEFEIGGKKFILDEEKAEKAFHSKRVINGLDTMFFNILPLRYQWAYDTYKDMKSAHWDPEETNLEPDFKKLESEGDNSDVLHQLISIMIHYESGYRSELLADIRDLSTAPELKLVIGRFVQDSNVRSDLCRHLMIGLQKNMHECADKILAHKSFEERSKWIYENIKAIGRNIDLSDASNKRQYATNVYASALFESISYQSIFIRALKYSEEKQLKGISELIKNQINDMNRRVKLMSLLFNELISENSDILSEDFKKHLLQLAEDALSFELKFIDESNAQQEIIPAEDFKSYATWKQSQLLNKLHLAKSENGKNPFQWLKEILNQDSEASHKSESSVALSASRDDEL